MRAPWSTLVVVSVVAMLASPALAQTPDESLRHAGDLFRLGIEELDRGSWVQACVNFERSAALVARPSNLVKIGLCRLRDRQHVNAWNAFQRARELNSADASTYREDLEHEIAQELARIPVVRVLIESPPAGLTLEIDGEILLNDKVGVFFPVEHGTRTLVARAPGYEPVAVSLEINDAQAQTVKLALQRRLGDAEAEPPAAAPRLSGKGSRSRSGTFRHPPGSDWGLALAGVGVAGLAAGGALGLATLNRVSDSNQYCGYPDGSCDPRGVALRERAGRLQTAGFVVSGVAALAAAGGVYLLLTNSGSDAPRAPKLSARLSVGGVAVTGRLRW
jgi:hypothetical protein